MQYRLTIVAPTLFTLAVSVAHAQAGDYAARARAAAPTVLSAAASVARIDTATGEVRVLTKGTNGITCTLLPDATEAPMCADEHAWQWFVDAFAGKPKPTNAAPGIAYMAKGGAHFETLEGAIVMIPVPNSIIVEEPPHWMLMWPISAKTTGLPTRPNPAGMFVMFDGTPYSHLMIYQDPMSW